MPRLKTDLSFKTFWDSYGLKKARQAAERAWSRLSEKDRRSALAGIPAYRDECRRTGVAMKYGQGYLNGRRWEDEIDASPNDTRNNRSSDGEPKEMDLW